MTKLNPIGVRFSPQDIAALKRLAALDDRSVASLVRKVVSEWLKKQQEGLDQ